MNILEKNTVLLKKGVEIWAFHGTDFKHLKLWDLPVRHRCCIYKGELTAAMRWALDCPLPGNERWARGISGPMTLVPLNRKVAVKQLALRLEFQRINSQQTQDNLRLSWGSVHGSHCSKLYRVACPELFSLYLKWWSMNEGELSFDQ
jgi:hypothetical protein